MVCISAASVLILWRKALQVSSGFDNCRAFLLSKVIEWYVIIRSNVLMLGRYADTLLISREAAFAEVGIGHYHSRFCRLTGRSLLSKLFMMPLVKQSWQTDLLLYMIIHLPKDYSFITSCKWNQNPNHIIQCQRISKANLILKQNILSAFFFFLSYVLITLPFHSASCCSFLVSGKQLVWAV